jgi:hypothetical protein
MVEQHHERREATQTVQLGAGGAAIEIGEECERWTPVLSADASLRREKSAKCATSPPRGG